MIEGGCRCGAVRYAIDRDDLPPSYACHCHQCQRASGSAFGVQALAAEDRLTVTGPVVVREIETEGRISVQRFCDRCLTRLYNTNTSRPGIAVVRAGTLDRSEEVACSAHIFTAFRQRWVTIPDDVPSWPEAAPVADLTTALRAGSRDAHRPTDHRP